jgi:hypothetical protein
MEPDNTQTNSPAEEETLPTMTTEIAESADDALPPFHTISDKSKLSPEVIAGCLEAWKKHAPTEFQNIVDAPIEQ